MMLSIRTQYFLFLVLTFLYMPEANAQIELEDFSDTREVIISNGDSLIIVNVATIEYKLEKIYSSANYHWFDANKVWTNVGGYDGFLLNGNFTVKDASGKMIRNGKFKNGLKTGIWIEWYPNGERKILNEWEYGQLDGDVFKWSPKGELISHYVYKNDMKNGKYEIFEKGQLIEKGKMQNNLKSGKVISYSNGNLKSKVRYRNGKKHGLTKTYDHEGKLLKKERYIDNELKIGREHKSATPEKKKSKGSNWKFWKDIPGENSEISKDEKQ